VGAPYLSVSDRYSLLSSGHYQPFGYCTSIRSSTREYFASAVILYDLSSPISNEQKQDESYARSRVSSISLPLLRVEGGASPAANRCGEP